MIKLRFIFCYLLHFNKVPLSCFLDITFHTVFIISVCVRRRYAEF